MADRPPEAERAADAVANLDAITRRLRRECPWDREQDERSIVPHTVEEAYELADAAASGDDDKLLDELGDVLFQVHFLALLMEERGSGDLATVAEQITEKLVRRHPHVFGEAEAESADEVLANWDRIKREREGRGGVFTDVPENLPALLYARKLQRRATARAPEGSVLGVVGPEDGGPAAEAAVAKIERLERLRIEGASASPGSDPETRKEIELLLGDLLFSVVDLARRLRCDPELALRAAAERFSTSIAES